MKKMKSVANRDTNLLEVDGCPKGQVQEEISKSIHVDTRQKKPSMVNLCTVASFPDGTPSCK